MIRPAAVLLGIAMVIGSPGAADACFCSGPRPLSDPGLWALGFDAVFLGRLRAIEPGDLESRYAFEVIERFRGDVEARVSVLSGSGTCSLLLRAGQEQVVFARRKDAANVASLCYQPWGVRLPNSSVGELLRRLREVKANQTFGAP